MPPGEKGRMQEWVYCAKTFCAASFFRNWPESSQKDLFCHYTCERPWFFPSSSACKTVNFAYPLCVRFCVWKRDGVENYFFGRAEMWHSPQHRWEGRVANDYAVTQVDFCLFKSAYVFSAKNTICLFCSSLYWKPIYLSVLVTHWLQFF